MLFAGFNVYNHHHTLLGIIVFGVVGDVVGASIAYAIGYWGRRELFERHGSKVHISQARLERAHSWARRYGAPAVFVSRLIPGVRFVFAYAAGIAEMGYVRFLAFATLGSIAWVTALGFLGREVGSGWQRWRQQPPNTKSRCAPQTASCRRDHRGSSGRARWRRRASVCRW